METLLQSLAQTGVLHFVHWVVIFPLMLLVTRFVVGRLFTVTFPTVFIASYAVMIFAQAPNIYLEIQLPLYLLSVWAVPFLYLFSVGAAMFMAARLGKAGLTPPVTVSARDKMIARLAPIPTAALVCLPLLFIFDRGVQSISLIFLIFNPAQAVEAMTLRIGGLQSNISPLLTAVYSYGRTFALPTYIALLAALSVKKVISRRHLMIGLIPTAIFVTFTAAKAPLAFVICSAFLAMYLVHGAVMSVRTTKLVVIGGLLGLVLPGLIYPLLYGKTGAEGATVMAESVWRRISWVPSWTTALYFEAFGSAFDFLGTSSNRVLARLTGEQSVNAAALVYDEYFRATIAGGLVNSCYFASFYADWGIAGVVWGTVVVGLLSGGLQVYFDSRQQDLTTAGIRAAVLIASIQLHATNFYSVAFGRGFLFVPMAFFVFELLLPRAKEKEPGGADASVSPYPKAIPGPTDSPVQPLAQSAP